MRMKPQALLFSLLLVMCSAIGLAQQKRTVSGSVKDTDGHAVAQASYLIKGTNVGGVTDANGRFSIAVDGSNAVLVFSYVGFTTEEVAVGTQTTLTVTLQRIDASLSDVVVTALGVKRQKKSLGYAVQQVKGSTLLDAREPNLTNALSGVVAGLQVIRSSNGPAGSSKIILRGNNSLTGSNQPLIVVDGVPVDNFTGASNNDYWNPSLDMGNGLADLNADDIESISVLKGPSAAALYGTRAGNGVILISTKTGKKQAGLGITLSSTLGFESIFTNPKLQQEFGQGSNAVYDPIGGANWGPKIAGQQVTNWAGEKENLRGFDNLSNFYQQGVTQNHNLSFQQQYKSTSVYTSFNRFEDRSMIPGAKLTRTNITGRSVSKFGKDDKWTIDTKVQYSQADARNRPMGGNNWNNASSMLYSFPNTVDITRFKAGSDQFGNMIWYNTTGNQINPYWAKSNNLNSDIRDRFIMTASLKYNITDWMDVELKGGSDMYTNNSEAKTYSGSPLTTTGRYSLGKSTFNETNYSALLSARKNNLFGKLGGNASVGGNLMKQKASGLSSNAGELEVPNLFSINNSRGTPGFSQSFSERRINSVYGTVGVNWDGYVFLDATFRNDWTSTLHKTNRSFFYPSVSLSYVFTDMFDKMGVDLPKWLSYGKLRGSYAAVGNDMLPYQLYNVYSIGRDPNGNTTASRNSILFDANVRSELIKSIEAGAELRFFGGRFGVDFSYYKSNATNQLINLPMDPISGYNYRKINAGDIQNQGFEIMVDGQLLQNKKGFNWNISANFSRNRNLVKDIYSAGKVTEYRLGGFDDVGILAVQNALYGEIYGSKFLRVEDKGSAQYGQLILSSTGLPQRGAQNVRLGNQQATGLMGITNTFGYKGLTFAFLVDARFGGQIFSATHVYLQGNGSSSVTVKDGDRKDFVVAGVVPDGSGGYKANTVATTPQLYWQAISQTGNLGISEANLYDATNIRLRNVQLSYDIPKSFLGKNFIQRAKVGVSCNNVWMIKSNMNGLDPESVFATGTNATGFENASPPTNRTFLINLSLSF